MESEEKLVIIEKNRLMKQIKIKFYLSIIKIIKLNKDASTSPI